MVKVCLSVMVLALSAQGPVVLAKERPAFIAVVGQAQVSDLPEAVEIQFWLHAKSELAADALLKVHQSKDRIASALQPQESLDLAVTLDNVQFACPLTGESENLYELLASGQSILEDSLNCTCSGMLRIRLNHLPKDEAQVLERIAKLMDLLQEQGIPMYADAQEGQAMSASANPYNPAVTSGGDQMHTTAHVEFFLNGSSLFEAAQTQAFQNAVDKATVLAKLTGKPLGEVLSIEELPTEQTTGDAAWPAPSGASDFTRLIKANAYRPLFQEVKLRVRFALQP